MRASSDPATEAHILLRSHDCGVRVRARVPDRNAVYIGSGLAAIGPSGTTYGTMVDARIGDVEIHKAVSRLVVIADGALMTRRRGGRRR
jgi:hypothetical protein